MGNTEVDMKVLVPVYSKEYQEQKRFTIGELPEVFRYVRSVRVDGEYVIIVYVVRRRQWRKQLFVKNIFL